MEVPSKSTWRAIAGDLHALVKAKVRQALEQLISDLDGVGPFIHGHIEATMTESSCFLTLIGSFLDRTLELQRFVLGMKVSINDVEYLDLCAPMVMLSTVFLDCFYILWETHFAVI